MPFEQNDATIEALENRIGQLEDELVETRKDRIELKKLRQEVDHSREGLVALIKAVDDIARSSPLTLDYAKILPSITAARNAAT